MKKIVNAARLAPSAANLQPLEYVVINKKEKGKKIFPHLTWAEYIRPQGTPRKGERPTAYIVVLVNKDIREENYGWDLGAAVENMILLALDKGIASCWLRNLNHEGIRESLNIISKYIIDSVLALGYPAEKPVIEEMEDTIKYWKDESGNLHVPKRKLCSVLHRDVFKR